MNTRSFLVALSLMSFLTGLLFYVFFRGYFVTPSLPMHVAEIHVMGLLQDSFPSFVHTFAMTILSMAFGMNRKNAVVLWLIVGFLLELTQPIFSIGTFDVGDLAGVVLGAVLADALTKRMSRVVKLRWAEGPLILLAISTSVASSEPPKCPDCTNPLPHHNGDTNPGKNSPQEWVEHEPVYMSYEELRNSFSVEPAKPIKEFGKILVLGEKLLVSEPNSGVHIFNNSDPAHPEAQFFLNIPGNVDLAAKDDVLYADSFVDLLVIRLGGEKPQLLQRVENTFDWNPFQAIKDPKVQYFPSFDRRRGVVVDSRIKQMGASK